MPRSSRPKINLNHDHRPRPWCKTCKKSFSGSSELTRHIKIHIQDKKYKCKYCTMRFIQSGALKTHLNTHTGAKPYKCEACPMIFGDGSSRSRHNKEIHMGFVGHLCPVCIKRKTIKRRAQFITHLKKHHNIDPSTMNVTACMLYEKKATPDTVVSPAEAPSPEPERQTKPPGTRSLVAEARATRNSQRVRRATPEYTSSDSSQGNSPTRQQDTPLRISAPSSSSYIQPSTAYTATVPGSSSLRNTPSYSYSNTYVQPSAQSVPRSMARHELSYDSSLRLPSYHDVARPSNPMMSVSYQHNYGGSHPYASSPAGGSHIMSQDYNLNGGQSYPGALSRSTQQMVDTNLLTMLPDMHSQSQSQWASTAPGWTGTHTPQATPTPSPTYQYASTDSPPNSYFSSTALRHDPMPGSLSPYEAKYLSYMISNARYRPELYSSNTLRPDHAYAQTPYLP